MQRMDAQGAHARELVLLMDAPTVAVQAQVEIRARRAHKSVSRDALCLSIRARYILMHVL